ncbi:LacI family DNA-binding transcriptional regulator [Nonomuraea sp. K274]|uniref:LacI family DNA-binding transcriptional regulator n=1 Tax=Nonomuraea cypriaca TaxID=1187855 RepID=A0A931EYR7_9ACTN|nr:LacI family DNA-binding transcriptional regulator [Nonomuraea cypriaca]MBF8185496.1 LacI family DNA-binding transcriptional regulator [Nonomuraea cypriaca]
MTSGWGAPKLTAIAREAGVSPSTVSKVINGRMDVSTPTRARVMDILRRRGYRRRTPPNQRLFDLLLDDLAAPYAGQVIAAAERAARRVRADLVVCTPCAAWLGRVTARGSAGVLLAGARLTPLQSAWLADHHLPVATIDISHRPLDELCMAVVASFAEPDPALEPVLNACQESDS